MSTPRLSQPLALRGLPLVLAGLALGVVSSVALSALADGDPTTDDVPRMFPYQGVLESDGVPVNATGERALLIRFALFDGPDAETPVYVQDNAVEVFGGRFTTTLGPAGATADGDFLPIAPVIEAGDDLYLGMILLGDPDDDADDVALSGRQRILATPYALWTTSAASFSVANDLSVGGAVNAAQVDAAQVNADRVEVTHDLNAGGAVTATGAVTADQVNAAQLNLTGDAEVGGQLNAARVIVDDRLDASAGEVRVFGQWQDGLSFNTTYTAASDGFVVGYAYRSSRDAHVRLDAFTPANTRRLRDYNRTEAGDNGVSITMPVREGDTWRVNLGGSPNETRLSFIPLGR